MNFKTDRTFMMNELNTMLNDGEVIYDPFYGCLMQRGLFPYNYFGFFARTDTHLLIAILNPLNGKQIAWYNRVPLDIENVEIRKSIIPKQYIVIINFNEGDSCKIRISKWLFCGDFIDQEQNVISFLDYLKHYTN